MSALILFLYFFLGAWAIALLCGRRFEDSLAPLSFLQVLLMMVTGILFQSLSAGILIGIVLIITAWGVIILRVGSIRSFPDIVKSKLTIDSGITSILTFTILFLFVWLINSGKFFNRWDEFNHWGIFIKECLRSDRLYCASAYPIGHKDYVPAVTLFEVLWARLSFRFLEADAFRSIQFFQLILLLPVATAGTEKIRHAGERVWIIAGRMLLLLGLPLLFSSINFYHSIYTDGTVAMILFYCMWTVYREPPGVFRDLVLTVSLSVLILTKMLAVVFLPMVVIYAFVTGVRELREEKKGQVFAGCTAMTVLPLICWWGYNHYARRMIGVQTGGQTFGGHGIGKLLAVLAHDGSISYQAQVERAYGHALILRGVIWKLPYAEAVILVIMLLLIVAFFRKKADKGAAGRIRLLALWCLIAGVVYAAVMYYLYMTSFSEYEASTVENFERYMSSLLMGMAFFVPMIFFFEFAGFSARRASALTTACIMIWAMALIMHGGGQVKQMLPGNLTGETEMMGEEARFLREHVPEDSSVLVISRGDRGFYGVVLRYECFPMSVNYLSPGPAAFDGDVWSTDMSKEQFVKFSAESEYLWLYHTDDAFEEKYAGTLCNLTDIHAGGLYLVEEENDVLATRLCAYYSDEASAAGK